MGKKYAKYFKKIPTSAILHDLKGMRRGVVYARGGMNKTEMMQELARRKKLGLVRKDAGKAKRVSSNQFGINTNIRIPKLRF